MEKNYVTVEVGFDALFNAMITRATEDMASKNIKVADDAKKGLSEWLMVMKSTGSGITTDIDIGAY